MLFPLSTIFLSIVNLSFLLKKLIILLTLMKKKWRRINGLLLIFLISQLNMMNLISSMFYILFQQKITLINLAILENLKKLLRISSSLKKMWHSIALLMLCALSKQTGIGKENWMILISRISNSLLVPFLLADNTKLKLPFGKSLMNLPKQFVLENTSTQMTLTVVYWATLTL